MLLVLVPILKLAFNSIFSGATGNGSGFVFGFADSGVLSLIGDRVGDLADIFLGAMNQLDK